MSKADGQTSPSTVRTDPYRTCHTRTGVREVGIDYAGPVYTKSGSTRRPIVSKSYICVFVSLSVKAVHLELVSSLTSEAFIATLRRFIARRGHPTLIMSDHGQNFIGANRELRDLFHFLE